MVFNELCSKIRLILIAVVGVFRRAMCCFPRRRKSSVGDTETLLSVNVVRENHGRKVRQDNDRDWNSWDDSPRTVEEHIEQYRLKMANPATSSQDEPEMDFFTDMTPKIKPQKVYFMSNSSEEKTDFSRLEAKNDGLIPIQDEEWLEEDPGAWDELDTEATKQLIREKRKELRDQRRNANRTKGISNNEDLAFAKKVSNSRHS